MVNSGIWAGHPNSANVSNSMPFFRFFFFFFFFFLCKTVLPLRRVGYGESWMVFVDGKQETEPLFFPVIFGGYL